MDSKYAMPVSKETVRQEVTKLVAKLRELAPPERDAYKKKEENTKKDFILPLFRALGWDVENAQEVFAEYDASNGAVDYAFRIGGVSRFFVEAKPLEAAQTDSKPIKQAIGYALHRGVPWAILTSFDNLHIFYALGEAPKPEMLRWKTLHYTDYIPHFDDLWLLSRESMESGATDEAAHRDGRLPPRLSIEQRLFRQFREWREKLTNDLLRYHQDKLTDTQVDEVVERLFNRLIFIRNCEDRQIEDRLLWQAWQEWLSKKRSGSLVASVRRIFNQFRDWYDSDLFPDKPHLLDSPNLVHLDDDPLEEIVRGLYTLPGGYADYDFKQIDADVLGAVYEQYLGHVSQVARERAERKARQLALIGMAAPQVELVEKRVKRKQQGIYYTPKWVVDYIVRETVGNALDEAGRGKGVVEERLFSIRILDPACGSGSFLIRAYDELLRRAAALSERAEEHVFADERGAILRRSIYGVDLDPQAVDIARLNLMLRGLARRERLPELKENVQTGNSLISGGERELRPYFGDAWEAKHPLNWTEWFPQVMGEGGFDVVLGNPPYVRIQSLHRDEADYYREHFETAFGSFDIYVLFVEQGIKLLKPGGRLGFICSGKFLKAEYGKRLQQLLRKQCLVENIIDLSALTVFAEATTYPAIVIVRKQQGDEPLRYVFVPQAAEGAAAPNLDGYQRVLAPQEAIVKGVWPPLERDDALVAKLSQNTVPLGEMADRLFQGLVTGADKVFVLQKRGQKDDGTQLVFSRTTGSVHEIEADLLRPVVVASRHIRRYSVGESGLLLLFPYLRRGQRMELASEEILRTKFPKTWEYLVANRDMLDRREAGRHKGPSWYRYGRTQNLGEFDQPKLMLPYMTRRIACHFDSAGVTYTVNVTTGGYSITLKEPEPRRYHYLMAILNSRVAHSWMRARATAHQGGYYGVMPQHLSSLPIRRIDPANKADVEMRDRIVQLVERMLDLKKRISAKGDAQDNEREDLEREAERTDREIDRAVYDLYDLTEAERRLVETELGR